MSRERIAGRRLLRRLGISISLALAPLVVAVLAFACWVYAGVVAGASEPVGTLHGFDVAAPVSIVRDGRGIPHIRAQNERDLYFAEGYAQGCDRLFQLDLFRRVVDGRLSEVLGEVTLATDERARLIDVKAIVAEQLTHLTPAQRTDLEAFAAGVNAAKDTRPLPPEFRALGYKPEPWTAADSLTASFNTVLSLVDSWDDIESRDMVLRAAGPGAADAFFSMSDPNYDAPPVATHAPIAKLPDLKLAYPNEKPQLAAFAHVPDAGSREGSGSNNFAAGGAQTTTHRALLGSDPHLEMRMPGVWWLADLEAPGVHVAGATLAGVPGIVLGHNAHLAWGATNGTVTTVSIYRETFRSPSSDEYRVGNTWRKAEHRHETIAVRFGSTVERDYLRTRHGFVFDDQGTTKYAATWTGDTDRRAAIAQFDGLARATTVADAIALLAQYPGPPQNFALADDAGNAGFTLAGEIPIDPVWGLHAHDGPSDAGAAYAYVPAAQLPHVASSRDAVIWTANARTYGAKYPYRLTASFTPPYRAARIKELLAHRPLDVAAFSAIQADETSLPERELAADAVAALSRLHAGGDPDLAPALNALRDFDGTLRADSHSAPYAVALRRASIDLLARYHMPHDVESRYLGSFAQECFTAVLRMLRERPHGWVPHDDYDGFLRDATREALAQMNARGEAGAAWGDVGWRVPFHPLNGFGFKLWNGVRIPGGGDAYSPHVQAPANAQSYRAVWDVGNWDAGGIVIPQGESGEPGSAHYTDLAGTWIAGTLVPLPFGDAAVSKAAADSLLIER